MAPLPIAFDCIEDVADLLSTVAQRTRSLDAPAPCRFDGGPDFSQGEREVMEMVAAAMSLRIRRSALDTLLRVYGIEVRLPPGAGEAPRIAC